MQRTTVTIKCLLLLLLMISVSFPSLTANAQQLTPAVAAEQLNLMPVPASITMQAGRLRVANDFKVATTGFVDDRLRNGVSRMLARLAGRTVVSISYDRATDEASAPLVIRCERPGEAIPSVNENESYRLDITEKQARLTAPTVVGALRGMAKSS